MIRAYDDYGNVVDLVEWGRRMTEKEIALFIVCIGFILITAIGAIIKVWRK